jgi:propanediol utilization protein
MKNLRLNNNEFVLLKEIISLEYTFKKSPNNTYIIQADNLIFDKMLDQLSDYLVNNCLNDNDELNAIGIDVEKLIDSISEIYYED